MDKLGYRQIFIGAAVILVAAVLLSLGGDDHGPSGGSLAASDSAFAGAAESAAADSGATAGNAAAAKAFESAKAAQAQGAPGAGDDAATGSAGDDSPAPGSAGETPASIPTPPGPPLSAPDYRSKANAICADHDHQIAAAAKKSGPSANIIAFNLFVENTFLPVTEDQLSQLEQLAPPAADADKVTHFLQGMANGILGVKQNPNSLLAADPFDDASNLADAYGIHDCITGPYGD